MSGTIKSLQCASPPYLLDMDVWEFLSNFRDARTLSEFWPVTQSLSNSSIQSPGKKYSFSWLEKNAEVYTSQGLASNLNPNTLTSVQAPSG